MVTSDTLEVPVDLTDTVELRRYLTELLNIIRALEQRVKELENP